MRLSSQSLDFAGGDTLTAKLRSWGQKFKQHPFIATGVIVALTALILSGLVVYFGWGWTGLSSSQTTTITTEVIQSPQKKVTTTQTTQPGKMLWDWLQLLGVLAIPIVVGFGTAFFTRQQAKTSEANVENQQQEELLRTYFDKMSELVLNSELSTNLNVQSIVRARTLAALHILNATRKGIVFRFLHDSNLLQHVKSYLYLLDLSNTDLIRIDLRKADLYKADLREADLREADLCGTDLRGANLERADLRGANLERAKLDKAELGRANLSRAN